MTDTLDIPQRNESFSKAPRSWGSWAWRSDEDPLDGGTVTACREMLRFALAEAITLSNDLRADIGKLDLALSERGLRPLLLKSTRVQSASITDDTLAALLLSVHGELAQAVAPATPAGLAYVNKKMLRPPVVVLVATSLAFISAIAFLITTLLEAVQSSNANGPIDMENTPAVEAGARAARPSLATATDADRGGTTP